MGSSIETIKEILYSKVILSGEIQKLKIKQIFVIDWKEVDKKTISRKYDTLVNFEIIETLIRETHINKRTKELVFKPIESISHKVIIDGKELDMTNADILDYSVTSSKLSLKLLVKIN